MRSELVKRDWAVLWRRVVDAAFRDPREREEALAILEAYAGTESDRVRLGVLKVADCRLEKMRALVEMARRDWRDLLGAAEYPLSSRKSRLAQTAPEKYDRLLAKEQEEYESWLRRFDGS